VIPELDITAPFADGFQINELPRPELPANYPLPAALELRKRQAFHLYRRIMPLCADTTNLR
jgi:hypothetical protein